MDLLKQKRERAFEILKKENVIDFLETFVPNSTLLNDYAEDLIQYGMHPLSRGVFGPGFDNGCKILIENSKSEIQIFRKVSGPECESLSITFDEKIVISWAVAFDRGDFLSLTEGFSAEIELKQDWIIPIKNLFPIVQKFINQGAEQLDEKLRKHEEKLSNKRLDKINLGDYEE